MAKKKTLKVGLLRIVRKEIKMYPTVVAGFDCFVIKTNLSKTSLPANFYVLEKVTGIKVIREFRIKAAREIAAKKRLPDEEWDGEIKV